MDAPSDKSAEVRDNPERRRFELSLGERGSAFIDYRDRPPGPARAGQGGNAVRVRVLTHAEVPAALRGGGIGARLTRGTLDLIRARGERIVPACPYVVDFIRRHPDYRDLLAD
ncbi:MAG TPA: GNAT family N-acetyltransferase [Steroidobacteraceae bacterium]|nr:GNAT family N-acetyltransferase [Steroidobacteraceae bacterium]